MSGVPPKGDQPDPKPAGAELLPILDNGPRHAAPPHGAHAHDGPRAPARRDWFFNIGVALNAVAGLALAVPLIGFVFSSFAEKKDPRDWISLGELDAFPEKTTRIATYRNPFTRPWDGETADIPCWVRRIDDKKFQVFAINCTHLGCPVRWFQESGLFMCPCHGGAYYEDGERAAGPPPRGLFQYDYKVEKGHLWVRGGQMPTLSNPL